MKGELAAYYESIAPVIVPHIRARPITMERYPAGIDKKGFIQKDVSKGFPAWLERVEVPKKDGTVHHPIVTDTRSLLWIVNQNTITPHVWSSRAPDLYHPDICVFDLDPSIDDPEMLRAAALGLRELLEKLGLPSWVKTSGSKGFHIVVPLGQGGHRGGLVVRAPCGFDARAAGAGAPDAGVQQGRSRPPDSGRHWPEQLQRDVGRALCRAREARRARLGAVHVGGDRAGARPRTFTLRIFPAASPGSDLWSARRRGHGSGVPSSACGGWPGDANLG
jgi:hypothetical protein